MRKRRRNADEESSRNAGAESSRIQRCQFVGRSNKACDNTATRVAQSGKWVGKYLCTTHIGNTRYQRVKRASTSEHILDGDCMLEDKESVRDIAVCEESGCTVEAHGTRNARGFLPLGAGAQEEQRTQSWICPSCVLRRESTSSDTESEDKEYEIFKLFK